MRLLAVHVTPKSGKNAVLGLEDGEIRCKVTAPPDGGKANKAVVKLLADAIGIPKSAVDVASGQTSRHKRLRIDADDALVDAWLAGMGQ